jgi:hypothetical protein
LKIAPSLVLPSFLKALLSGHPVVAYEVLLAIRRLVKKYTHYSTLSSNIEIRIVDLTKNLNVFLFFCSEIHHTNEDTDLIFVLNGTFSSTLFSI